MPKIEESREDRIAMEIVVDAHGEYERALGWYYYLEENLNVPFKAKCVSKRDISPLKRGEEVEVIGMPSENECERGMYVTVKWEKRSFSVPLSQLEAVDSDARTRDAIEDWHYWVGRGYRF